MKNQPMTIGILGGLGPMATVDLYIKIIKAIPAKRDQDHLHVIIDSNPKIPDRTEHILSNGPDPVPLLIDTAINLERAGADFILIPCNTAHYYFDQIKDSIDIDIIHMVKETAKYIMMKGYTSAGILSTDGTIAIGLYNDLLKIDTVFPHPKIQKLVMDAIYGRNGIKAGELETANEILLCAASHLIERGAECVVAACTEISLTLKPEHVSVPLIDPALVLTQVAIDRAFHARYDHHNICP